MPNRLAIRRLDRFPKGQFLQPTFPVRQLALSNGKWHLSGTNITEENKMFNDSLMQLLQLREEMRVRITQQDFTLMTNGLIETKFSTFQLWRCLY